MGAAPTHKNACKAVLRRFQPRFSILCIMCRAAERTHGRRRAGHKFTLSHISSPYRFRQRRKTRPTPRVRAFISACFRQRNRSVRSVRPALQRSPVLEYSRHVLHKCELLQSGIHFRTKAANGKATGVLVLIVSLHEGLVAADVLFSEFFMSASFFSFFFWNSFVKSVPVRPRIPLRD